MTLRFLAIDPDTNGDNCPALFLEEESGDRQSPVRSRRSGLVRPGSRTHEQGRQVPSCPGSLGADSGLHSLRVRLHGLQCRGWRAGPVASQEHCSGPAHSAGRLLGVRRGTRAVRLLRWRRDVHPHELTDDPEVVRICTEAFGQVWVRAIPHDQYRPN
jgi:hypothetical protein